MGLGQYCQKGLLNTEDTSKGFSDPKQLNEVWGLDKKVVNKVLNQYEIKTVPKIDKISVKQILH